MDAPLLTWTDADGTAWPLIADLGVIVEWGLSGFGSPARQIATTPLPGGGSLPKSAYVPEGHLVLPLYVYGSDETAFRTLIRSLRGAFDPIRGDDLTPGSLEAAWADGQRRMIEAMVTDIPEELDQGKSNLDHIHVVLEMTCPDAYWRDAVAQTAGPWVLGTTRDWLAPYMTVSSGLVLGSGQVITNDGDVEAWPIWTILGPATNVVLTNTTTGKSFSIPSGVGSGETLTVNTKPGDLAVTSDSSSGSQLGRLGWPGAQLWPLVKGDNNVTLQLDGATSATRVNLSYYRRYRGI
jgi:hypothetical protein